MSSSNNDADNNQPTDFRANNESGDDQHHTAVLVEQEGDDYFDDDQRVDPRTNKTTVTNNRGMNFQGRITSGNYYHGIGEFHYHDMAGEDYTYKGEILNGVLHGKGIVQFSGGDVYVGQFENGVYHGRGVYRRYVDYEDEKGKVYENSWVVMEGIWERELLVDGTIRYPDDSIQIVTRELLRQEEEEVARMRAAGEPTPEYDEIDRFLKDEQEIFGKPKQSGQGKEG